MRFLLADSSGVTSDDDDHDDNDDDHDDDDDDDDHLVGPIGRTNYIVCVGSGTRVYLLFKVQTSQKRPTPTFSLNTKGGAFRTSAELALRWSAHRLEQAVHARCSKILRPGTAILQKGRCIEQLPQRASCIAGCAGLGWLHTVNQLRS